MIWNMKKKPHLTSEELDRQVMTMTNSNDKELRAAALRRIRGNDPLLLISKATPPEKEKIEKLVAVGKKLTLLKRVIRVREREVNGKE